MRNQMNYNAALENLSFGDVPPGYEGISMLWTVYVYDVCNYKAYNFLEMY